MEESKWMIVRRETTLEKIKKKVKKIIFNLFGIEEVKKSELKNTTKQKKNNCKKEKKLNKEITIELKL